MKDERARAHASLDFDAAIQQFAYENQKFAQILAIQRRVGSVRDLGQLLPLVIAEFSDLVDADRSTLFLLDHDTMELRARFAQGLKAEIHIPLRMGIVGTAVLRRELTNVANARAHPFFNAAIDEVLGYQTESLLVTPVVAADGHLLGGIELLNKRSGRFTTEDEALVRGVARAIGSAGGIEGCCTREEAEALVERLCAKSNCERGSLFRLDAEQGALVSVYAAGVEGKPITLSLRLGIAGLVAVTGRALSVSNAPADPRFDPTADRVTGYATRNILCLPLVTPAGEVLGAVEVMNKRQGDFTDADASLLEGLCAIVAIAVENAQLVADQDRQFRSVIAVMAASIDAKDQLTAGHSSKVAEHALAIGRELGFSPAELDVLGVAALLHDYGKIGVDDQVLKKAGKLTDEERRHIQRHVEYTRSILDKMHFTRKYRAVPLIAASHHEMLDGSGYAAGLSGGEIPFMARILTVADVYEALTSDRHYRKAMGRDEALKVLEEGSGSLYDRHVVEALRNCVTGQRAPVEGETGAPRR